MPIYSHTAPINKTSTNPTITGFQPELQSEHQHKKIIDSHAAYLCQKRTKFAVYQGLEHDISNANIGNAVQMIGTRLDNILKSYATFTAQTRHNFHLQSNMSQPSSHQLAHQTQLHSTRIMCCR